MSTLLAALMLLICIASAASVNRAYAAVVVEHLNWSDYSGGPAPSLQAWDGTSLAFVAEGRSGCTTTFELDVGYNAGAPAITTVLKRSTIIEEATNMRSPNVDSCHDYVPTLTAITLA